MELYKKHRPRKLEEMVGAEGSVLPLKGMLAKGTLPHTLLFHGPSGCGKTTLARILRRELGCSTADFKELNCADFRGIDTIRDIARTMNLAATSGPVRIWLLDEVHQLSKDGQNAALKLLEDTPKHVYFFLCTTDPNKIINTIRTRCCEMPVRALTNDEIEGLVRDIVKKEGMKIKDSVVETIAEYSNGSVRTALVMLDRVQNVSSEDAEAHVQKISESQNEAIELCRLLIKRAKWSEIAKVIKGLKAEPEEIRWAVMGYASAVLLNSGNYQAYLVLQCFENNFYDSKKFGLVRACYEAVNAK